MNVISLDKYIDMRDGRPNIRGRRLPISFIASAERTNHFSIDF